MTKARRKYEAAPLTMSWAEVADALRKSETWLREHIDELPGFPRPGQVLNLFLRDDVERWVRSDCGHHEPSNDDELIRRARDGKGIGAVSRN